MSVGKLTPYQADAIRRILSLKDGKVLLDFEKMEYHYEEVDDSAAQVLSREEFEEALNLTQKRHDRTLRKLVHF